ncbi:MAG: DUF3857 domain-containing protein [Cyclonatronaceae bacterium]
MMANSVFSVLLTAFFLLGWIVESRADRPEFAVDHISPGLLLSDPAVVIRSDERSFVWEAPGKGRLHVRQVITLRNADAQAWSRQPLSYDSFRSVEDISGHIYDKDGNQVGRVRNRHITERSAVSGISLAEDAMMKIVELRHNEYPYTFELEYSYTFDGLIGFPAWAPMHRQVALESSRYTIQVPESVDINFATHHLEEAAEPDIQQQGMQTRYTWQLSHQPQLTSVQYGPPWHEMAPRLLVQRRILNMETKPEV